MSSSTRTILKRSVADYFSHLQLGCGGIFSPTPAVVAHWFKNRRGIALGLVAAGASIGGTVLPIMAKYLIPQVGYVDVDCCYIIVLAHFAMGFVKISLDDACIWLPAADRSRSRKPCKVVSLLYGLAIDDLHCQVAQAATSPSQRWHPYFQSPTFQICQLFGVLLVWFCDLSRYLYM